MEGETMRATQANRLSHRLELFGGPTLRMADGGLVSLSPTHEAFLTLVGGSGSRGLSRDRAIWLLWEDDDGPRARHRLRQLLHEVGVRLGFRPVEGEGGEAMSLNPVALPSDLDDFFAALEPGTLCRALEFERRGFGSSLRRVPGEAFEDWLTAKRVALRRELHDAAARQWDRHRQAGSDWPNARDAAEVLYALDPSEASLQKVVESRAATGQVGLAEAAFAEFSRGLVPGRGPSPATLALLERVRELSAVVGHQAGGGAEQLPLVGRKAHLDVALRLMDGLKDGTFAFMTIQGEAGVGKTRLFEEILREAQLKGFRCLLARPAELERHIPLNPLVDMAGHPDVVRHLVALEDPWRAVITSLLPSVPAGMNTPVLPYIPETSLSRRLYDAFTFLLASIAEERPTLLFIDDLQWVDDTTIAVLQFAQRRWRRGALGVVATLRADLVDQGQVVASYLTEPRDLPTTNIELEGLAEPEAEQLVELVAGGSLNRGVCTELCALGGRNPFYLIELTRDFLAGRIQLPIAPGDPLLLPISLRQLLDPRLAALGPGAATAAAYLAIWGRSVPLPALAAVLQTSLYECTGHVDELERSRLVLVERGAASIAHQLFRGAIYHGLTNARRMLLHRTVAEYLSTTDQPLPGELALHFAQAGDAAPAAQYGRIAADRALENGAVAEAAYFLQLLIENEKDEHLKAEATGDLARVLHLNREILRANPLLELAATRLRAVGDNARALRLDVRRVEGLAEVGAAPMSELLDRLGSIKSAARTAGDDEALAFALDYELHMLHRSGRVSEIRDLFGEIRTCARSGNPMARCQANASLALTVLFGDGDEGLRCAREALRTVEDEGLEEYQLLALNRLILALVTRGLMNLDGNMQLFSRAESLASKSGNRELRFHLQSNIGVFLLDSGDPDQAEVHFQRAGELVSSAEATVLRFANSFNFAEVALARRDFESAWRHFTNAESLAGPSLPRFYQHLVSGGIGLCALELGATSEARRRELALNDVTADWYFDPTILITFSARFLERRRTPSQAVELIEQQRSLVAGRFPCAWIRLTLTQAEMARRAGIAADMVSSLTEAKRVADTLKLPLLSAEIDQAVYLANWRRKV